MKPRSLFFSLALVLALALAACAPGATPAPTFVLEVSTAAPTAASTTQAAVTAVPTRPARASMILATTTSTQDSGLLDVLIPMFQKDTGYNVKVVAVGSGQALQMGQQGNADVLLVHSPSAEQAFMASQYGKERLLVMHNDFVIVGPTADPAKIKGDPSAVDAFKKIAAAGATFVSRGDKSGTNAEELALWSSASVGPAISKPAWYLESGQGMGATLTIANQKGAYTLTDRATYLANKAKLKLDILVEKDNSLLNVYHVITVNPAKWPNVNYAGAVAFSKWITSAPVQDAIGKFGVDKYGQQLFVPDAGKGQ